MQCGKVVVADDVVLDIDVFLRFRTRDANAGVPTALAEDERSEAGSFHTRQSADTFLDLLKHRNHARIVTLEPGDVGVDFETKNSFAIETSIDVGEIHEAADKQDCSHGQHKGDRDLSDDEDFTDWASGGAA